MRAGSARASLHRLMVAISLVTGMFVLPGQGAGAGISALAAPGGPQVSIAAISGDHGHAFVFAQVTDAIGSHPAPPGSSPTPYYSRWQAVPILAPGCPWIWAVFVYDRATNRQLNAPPPGSPAPNFHTTTFFCPGPTISPVAGPQLAIAQARLNLDLATALAPAHPTAGAPATISARLTGAVEEDLGLLLSMAIDSWVVDGWRVAFGDGQQTGISGGSDRITVPHTYASSIQYEAHVVASIHGTAQAAEYGAAGNPFLISRNFSVRVGNTLPVAVSGAPAVRYFPPVITALVSPTIAGQTMAPQAVALRRVEAPRGVFVDVYLRVQIVQEGYRTVDGRFAGWARSTLLTWRYAGSPGGRPDQILPEAEWLTPAAPLRLRWDSPDIVVGTGSRDYAVNLVLRIAVRYGDGVTSEVWPQTTFGVSVRYAAQNP
jgi:hypothetical protein